LVITTNAFFYVTSLIVNMNIFLSQSILALISKIDMTRSYDEFALDIH